MNIFSKLGAGNEALPPSAQQWPMVLDSSTNLIWQAANSTSKGVTFKDAEKAIASMNSAKFSGFDDWRLPTIKELLSIVDYTRSDPAIDIDYFTDTKSDWYWTATPAASSPADYAWIVHFYNGHSDWFHRDDEYFVRAVRSASQ